MKKIKICLFMLALMSLFSCVKVKAYNYHDRSLYNFNDWQESYLKVDGGVNVNIEQITQDQDGNYIMYAEYQESTELRPTSDGNGLPQSYHSKFLKYDQNFNKLFETNFYIVHQTIENPDPLAKNVDTTMNDLVVLANGNYLGVGGTFGLVRLKEAKYDNRNDSVYVILDKNGNKIYEKLYHDQGLNTAVAAAALADGGYIIKYEFQLYYYNSIIGTITGNYKKPTDFVVNETDKYYYVVYNSNNEVVDTITETDKLRISTYSFIENDSINKLWYKRSETSELKDNSYYLGSDIAGNPIYGGLMGHSRTGTSLKVGNSVVQLDYNLQFDKDAGRIPLIMFNDNSFLYSNKIVYSVNDIQRITIGIDPSCKEGEYSKLTIDKNTACGPNKVYSANDGTLIAYKSKATTTSQFVSGGNKIYINKPSQENKNNTKYIIDGKEVRYNLGTYIENDRTYININNLCSVMGCSFVRVNNNQTMIIRFNILGANHTIVHHIGSTYYKAYLEFPGKTVFSLKSPTFKSESVDVTSKEVDGQIYVPIRFIAEALGRYVEWKPAQGNEPATVIISAHGEGEFYEKYAVGVTKTQHKIGDTLTGDIGNNVTQLHNYAPGNTKPIYAYGIDKKTNKVIDIEHTVFHVASWTDGVTSSDYDGESRDTNAEMELGIYSDPDAARNQNGTFVIKNNKLYQEIMVQNNLTTVFDDNAWPMGFFAISNIEGYPFIRVVTVK